MKGQHEQNSSTTSSQKRRVMSTVARFSLLGGSQSTCGPAQRIQAPRRSTSKMPTQARKWPCCRRPESASSARFETDASPQTKSVPQHRAMGRSMGQASVHLVVWVCRSSDSLLQMHSIVWRQGCLLLVRAPSLLRANTVSPPLAAVRDKAQPSTAKLALGHALYACHR